MRCRAVCAACGAVLFICHRQLLSLQQFFQSVQLGFCGFLSEVLCRKADRGTHFNQTVIDTGVGGVLRVFQHIRREVGGDDQRLAAAVSAVNHIVDFTVVETFLDFEIVMAAVFGHWLPSFFQRLE